MGQKKTAEAEAKKLTYEQWKAQQDAYAASGGVHPCYD